MLAAHALRLSAVPRAGDLAEVYYGANHPMKPHRMCMAHSLILGYGLHEKMEVYVRSKPCLKPWSCTLHVPPKPDPWPLRAIGD